MVARTLNSQKCSDKISSTVLVHSFSSGRLFNVPNTRLSIYRSIAFQVEPASLCDKTFNMAFLSFWLLYISIKFYVQYYVATLSATLYNWQKDCCSRKLFAYCNKIISLCWYNLNLISKTFPLQGKYFSTIWIWRWEMLSNGHAPM